MTKLNIQFHFLSPVQVIKVTPKNLEEVAEWCGGTVARKESARVPGRVDSYVDVPTPRGAAISMAFPGMFITKRLAITEANEMKATFSVFRKDYFAKNYFDDPQTAVDATWERHDAEQRGAALMQQAIEQGSLTINLSGAGNPMEVAARIQAALNGDKNAVTVVPDSVVVEEALEVLDIIEVQLPITDEEIDPAPSMVEQRETDRDAYIEGSDNILDPARV